MIMDYDFHERFNDDFINEIVVEETCCESEENEELVHKNVEVVVAGESIDYSLLRGDILETDNEDCNQDYDLRHNYHQDIIIGKIGDFSVGDYRENNESVVVDSINIFTEP